MALSASPRVDFNVPLVSAGRSPIEERFYRGLVKRFESDKEAFRSMDPGGTGKLTQSQFRAGVKAIGEFDDEDIRLLQKCLDNAGGFGNITWEEFHKKFAFGESPNGSMMSTRPASTRLKPRTPKRILPGDALPDWAMDLIERVRLALTKRFETDDEAFTYFDSAANGQLTGTEFRTAMRWLDCGLTDDEIRELQKCVEKDSGGYGVISRKEFKSMFEFNKKKKKDISSSFSSLNVDVDNEGETGDAIFRKAQQFLNDGDGPSAELWFRRCLSVDPASYLATQGIVAALESQLPVDGKPPNALLMAKLERSYRNLLKIQSDAEYVNKLVHLLREWKCDEIEADIVLKTQMLNNYDDEETAETPVLTPPPQPTFRSTISARIATAVSNLQDTNEAVLEVCGKLREELRGFPDFVIISFTIDHNAKMVQSKLLELLPKGTQICGMTSARGVMTEAGFTGAFYGYSPAIGIWGFRDALGLFAVASVTDKITSPGGKDSTFSAIREAWVATGKFPAPPSLSLVIAKPECVQRCVEAVCSQVGPNTAVFGMSCANNAGVDDGKWTCFTSDTFLVNESSSSSSRSSFPDAIIIMIVSSLHVVPVFCSLHAPTSHSAAVTKVVGRAIAELDGEPALEVYSRWIGGETKFGKDKPNNNNNLEKEEEQVPSSSNPIGSIIWASALNPLGRMRKDGEWDVLLPCYVDEDHCIATVTSVKEGDIVTLLAGNKHHPKKVGPVVRDLITAAAKFSPEGIVGCLGSLDGIIASVVDQKGTDSILSSLYNSLSEAPFMCTLSFVQAASKVSQEESISQHLQHHAPLISPQSTTTATSINPDNAPFVSSLSFCAVVFGKRVFGNMACADLFFSYVVGSKEKSDGGRLTAIHLKEAMQNDAKFSVWVDEDRLMGSIPMETTTKRGIAISKVFICCLSRSFIQDGCCMAELKEALRLRKSIVPVLLPGFKPASRDQWFSESISFLSNFEAFDFRTAESRLHEWPTLLRHVHSLIHPSTKKVMSPIKKRHL